MGDRGDAIGPARVGAAAILSVALVACGSPQEPPSASDAASSPFCPFASQAAEGVDGSEDVLYVDAACNGTAVAATGLDEHSPALSADGQSIAYVSDDGDQASLMTIAAGADPVALVTEANLGGPAWSPDGARIAYWVDDGDGHPQAFVVDVHSGATRQLTENDSVNAQFAFSPDGAALALVRPSGTGSRIVVLDIDSGAESVLASPGRSYKHPQWSGQGDELAATLVLPDGDEAVVVLDPRTGDVLRQSASMQADVVALSWSGDAIRAGLAGQALNEADLLALDPQDLHETDATTTEVGVPAWPSAAAAGD